ncbi:MAG: hypothetical protein U0165_19430 [Polyangiaceae bacterium]
MARGLEKLKMPYTSFLNSLALEDLRLGRLQDETVNPEPLKAPDRLGRKAYSGLVFASLIGSGSVLATHVQPMFLGIVLIVLSMVVLLGQLVLDRRPQGAAGRAKRESLRRARCCGDDGAVRGSPR